jgi:hypothetical protein
MLKIFTSLAALFVFFFVSAGQVSADHSWGPYHWARQSNPFTLKLGDNLTSNWKPYLDTTSADWSESKMLDTTVVLGQGGKNCKATAGMVEVCNRKYGNNGWLGIAQIWIMGGEHITQGIAKMNDTYFTTKTYNTTAWKNMVMCQEVGHTLGLDHQDEDFGNANLGTCMDYTSSPESNQYPNDHDYEQLESIYSHIDSFTTVSATTSRVARYMGSLASSGNLDDVKEWGRKVKDNGEIALYERDFGWGNKLFTFVIWAK